VISDYVFSVFVHVREFSEPNAQNLCGNMEFLVGKIQRLGVGLTQELFLQNEQIYTKWHTFCGG
jgi:hypothetical protein